MGTGRLVGFFEIWRVTKVGGPRELRRYFDRHEIWVACWSSQEAGREVLLRIIGNEVIVGTVNLDRYRLLTGEHAGNEEV